MPKKAKKVAANTKRKVEPQPVSVAPAPSEHEQLTERRAYLLHLREQLVHEHFPVPSQLDVVLGQVNQRWEVLSQ